MIKRIKKRGFRAWLRRIFKPHGRYEGLRPLANLDEWIEAGVPPGLMQTVITGTATRRHRRVWLALDLAKGQEITVSVTNCKEGKFPRYTLIDETQKEGGPEK